MKRGAQIGEEIGIGNAREERNSKTGIRCAVEDVDTGAEAVGENCIKIQMGEDRRVWEQDRRRIRNRKTLQELLKEGRHRREQAAKRIECDYTTTPTALYEKYKKKGS